MIPYKFNPLGIEKSSFDINKGLLFYAPLTEDFEVIGGTKKTQNNWQISERNGKNGVTCVGTPFNYSSYLAYNLNNFNSTAFTVAIWYNLQTTDFKGSSGDYNMSLYYLGTKVKDKQVGYEVSQNYLIPGWAWSPNNYANIYTNNYTLHDDGEWHCYITSFVDGIVYDYQDGVLIAESTAPTLNITDKQIYIGSRVNDRRYWYGLLNNVAVYDYCFTEADAKGFIDYTK